MKVSRRELLCSLLAASTTQVGWSEDWPAWRGPRGDGSWQAPRLPERWPDKGLRILWRCRLGSGYAGISAWQGRVFTLDFVPAADSNRPKDNQRQTEVLRGYERVLCYAAADGRLLWQHQYPVVYGPMGGYANGPRTTPVVSADGKLYTLGAVGHLLCLNIHNGKVIWSIDTVEQLDAQMPEWGFAGTPVLDGDRLLVHLGARPGGCLVAFNRHNGKELWRALDDPTGYCNPVIFATPAGRLLVLWTPKHIHGLDADTGRPLWKVPYPVTYGVSIATPLLRENVLVVSGYWEGTKAIRVGPRMEDQQLLWTDNRHLRALMAQPLYQDGYGYLLDKDFGLTCFEWKSGKKIWDDDNQLTPRGRNPHASIVWLNEGNRALALNAVGELVLLRLHPRGYEETSRTKVLTQRVWGHPAFADRFMFAKTDGAEAWRHAKENELVCVELVPT